MPDQTTKRPAMETIGIVSLKWKRHWQKRIHPFGLTLQQFHLLRKLRENGSMFPSEIADILFCDRPTATVIIKNMEKKGWVKRRPDAKDYRRFHIALESSGEDKLDEITAVFDPHMKSLHPLDCFNPDERRRLNELLGRLKIHLDRILD